jgi:hypothetical protein
MERRALAAMVPPALLSAGGNYLVLHHGGQLGDVAAVTALGQAGYALTVMLLAFWPHLSVAARWRCAGQHALALVPTILVALAAEERWPANGAGVRFVLCKFLLVTGVAGLGALAAWRINKAQKLQPPEAAL